MQSYDVIIIGAGPAGVATARALAKLAPGLAARTLVLEGRASMEAGAGGGEYVPVTGASLRALEALELDVGVNYQPLTRASFEVGEVKRVVFFESPWRLIERRALDAWLFYQVSRALEVRLGEHVKTIEHQGDWVRVETQQRAYRAQVVIGADGAHSVVRQLLGWPEQQTQTEPDDRGWMAYGDISVGSVPLEEEGCLHYDLSMAVRGEGGFVWHSADVSAAQPCWRLGIVKHTEAMPEQEETPEQEGKPKCVSRPHFQRWLDGKGWGARAQLHEGSYRPYRYSAELPLAASRVMIVGEAAGIEPLLDDGLWQCLEYGCLAAHVVRAAFERHDFNLQRFDVALRKGALGREMSASQQMNARLLGEQRPRWLGMLLRQEGLAEALVSQASGLSSLHAQRWRLSWLGFWAQLWGYRV